jgi:hypothetical protein
MKVVVFKPTECQTLHFSDVGAGGIGNRRVPFIAGRFWRRPAFA